jgi:hypothetical protein
MGLGGQRHAPATLPLGKIRYPLDGKLGGPEGPSGRVPKISPHPQTVQPAASRYTDYVIPAHKFYYDSSELASFITTASMYRRGGNYRARLNPHHRSEANKLHKSDITNLTRSAVVFWYCKHARINLLITERQEICTSLSLQTTFNSGLLPILGIKIYCPGYGGIPSPLPPKNNNCYMSSCCVRLTITETTCQRHNYDYL